MASSELHLKFLKRFEEAQLYLDQGIVDIAVQIFLDMKNEIEDSGMAESEKEELKTRIRSILATAGREGAFDEGAELVEEKRQPGSFDLESDPSKAFDYGLALKDGQFWEDAIQQFKKAAAIGDRVLECWVLCGDCAVQLERWEEAIGYYEIVYTNPDIPEDLKRQVFLKITRCSQKGRKKSKTASGTLSPASTPFDQSMVTQLIGNQGRSWKHEEAGYLTDSPRTYRILNVLQAGITSSIVELECEETGRRYAGQCINPTFGSSLSPGSLFEWAHARLMTDSRFLVKVFDLAFCEDVFFIVREYLPLSLPDLYTEGRPLPLPLAIYIAHCILEGLGDLHLRMGEDRQIRNIYHLDLRPSRILINDENKAVKINNGGLWKVIEDSGAKEAGIRRLPLPFLAYRAPEQFRPYWSRRKPPIFTDVYLFGTLFYELLAGNRAFSASSYDEYEIQHCEHYPTPPKVWKPEIPDELNDMIMKCLERDPRKRWRSTTEIALIIQKCFNHELYSVRTTLFGKYLEECGTVS
jgi:serine/threonine protein kinase